MERFFATCPRGLEQVLAGELAALGADETQTVDGGVAFAGELTLCHAANLESRVASRILWQVGRTVYRSEHDIHDAAAGVPWPRHFDVRRSVRVDTAAIRSPV